MKTILKKGTRVGRFILQQDIEVEVLLTKDECENVDEAVQEAQSELFAQGAFPGATVETEPKE